MRKTQSRSDDSVKPGAPAPGMHATFFAQSPAGAPFSFRRVDVAPLGLEESFSARVPGACAPGYTTSPLRSVARSSNLVPLRAVIAEKPPSASARLPGAITLPPPASSLRPPNRRRSTSSGFTLVELLIVVAVIGVLTALTLPALQRARESARRATCRNNLRQLGVGLHQYHTVYETFPPGGVQWRPFGNKTKRQLAWSAFLLPYVEQGNVYAALDLNTPFDSPENAAGAATVLPIYVCPTSLRAGELVDGRGPCDYGGIFGERISSPNNPPKGVMLYDVSIPLVLIRDGASHTLIVAEDSMWPDGQWINGRNVFDQAYAINAAPAVENDIRSQHPGGAHALLADGAARFFAESLDLDILAALCTRAGGEPLGSF